MNQKITAIRSSIFHCVEKLGVVDGEYFDDGLLLIHDGKIVACGAFNKLKEHLADTPVMHLKNRILMPGFVDTHLHYPQYRIISSYGATLLDWLKIYTFPEEQKFRSSVYAKEVASLFFDELLKNGTTTAMSFCTSAPESVDAFFGEAKSRRLRMVGGKVMMDRNAPDGLCDKAQSSYEDSKKLIEKWHNKNRLSYAVTPRFAPTSTKEQLQLAGKLLQNYSGKNGILMQSHLNENTDEIAWVAQLFPEAESYFDVYQSYGLAGERCIFGHAIFNTETELVQMADSGSKVALCPRSNLFLGSGLFDLNSLTSHQIKVALASDVGGGDSFSMFQVMNEAYKVSKLRGNTLDPIQAFYLSTLAGAKLMQMDDCIGNFDIGKEADFIVINPNATTLLKERMSVADRVEDKLFCLINLADDRAIESTYILGEPADSNPNRSNYE